MDPFRAGTKLTHISGHTQFGQEFQQSSIAAQGRKPPTMENVGFSDQFAVSSLVYTYIYLYI